MTHHYSSLLQWFSNDSPVEDHATRIALSDVFLHRCLDVCHKQHMLPRCAGDGLRWSDGPSTSLWKFCKDLMRKIELDRTHSCSMVPWFPDFCWSILMVVDFSYFDLGDRYRSLKWVFLNKERVPKNMEVDPARSSSVSEALTSITVISAWS